MNSRYGSVNDEPSYPRLWKGPAMSKPSKGIDEDDDGDEPRDFQFVKDAKMIPYQQKCQECETVLGQVYGFKDGKTLCLGCMNRIPKGDTR